MIKNKNLQAILLILSVFLQFLSLLQYFLKNEESYRFNWINQYIIVVLISVILTCIQYSINKPKLHYSLLLIRFLMIFIVFLPTSIYIGLKQMFLFSFLIDTAFILPIPLNAIVSASSFFIIFFLTALSYYWTKKIPVPVLHDILYIFVYSILIILCASFLRYFYKIYMKTKNILLQKNNTINNLTDANTGFQHYIRIVEEKSSEDERNRIIREIHDSIGYTLTTITMLSECSLESSGQNTSPELVETLSNINKYAKNGLTDIRIALRLLKVKKSQSETDLQQLIKIIKAFHKATDIKINIDYSSMPNNFRKETSHLIFRLIQESMINSLRHGLATEISIGFLKDSGNFIIIISDNGKGFEELQLGIGLKGIQERLLKLNGDFNIYNSLNGVTLRISLPLAKVLDT